MPTLEEVAKLPPLEPISSNSIIIEEPESLTPELSPKNLSVDKAQASRGLQSKRYRTKSSKRLSGRRTYDGAGNSLHSISSLSSIGSTSTSGLAECDSELSESKNHHYVRHHAHRNDIVSQVVEWLRNEKARKASRKAAKHGGHAKFAQAADAARTIVDHARSDKSKHYKRHHGRNNSDTSEGSAALDQLEQILSRGMDLGSGGLITPTEKPKDSYFPLVKSKSKRQGSKKLLRKGSTIQASDAEYQEPDIDVPSAEVILDNSKTLGYSGGTGNSEIDLANSKKRAVREKQDWLQFKHEIVRLAHTLRLRGWRRLPIDKSGEIEVERLSGALTNAVYVVSPPSNLPETPAVARDSTVSLTPKKPPPKLLLRIYGPQVEHLIDRESELQILRRLARKRIGPRLLGTFSNGRFEQFFHAQTLTAEDLRIPETSKQIAKRMRELHDGIELLEQERDEGAFIWRNWDKWKDRCEEVISYLDNQILAGMRGPKGTSPQEWEKRGLVCGVEWSIFRSAVRRYRDWLYEQYSGTIGVRQHLVFAHNDTQYGNLLRLEPSGESPLLLPANQHKQLIVIDFEYASANVPGLEFANHFTEWCYDYHGSKPYALNTNAYPTPEEQHRFLKAYIQHRLPVQTRPHLSPSASSTLGPSGSISSFMLDSRTPPAQVVEEEKHRDEALMDEIRRLSAETRMWRVANSAQWVAWGIVQAKVPGMDEALEAQKNSTPKVRDGTSEQTTLQACSDVDQLAPDKTGQAVAPHMEGSEGEDVTADEEAQHEEEEFDYLGYAQERAMFFWGDVLQLGLVKKEELPAELLEKVKIVKY